MVDIVGVTSGPVEDNKVIFTLTSGVPMSLCRV